MPKTLKLLACFFLAIALPIPAYAHSSLFDSPELTIQTSPAEAQTFALEPSETVVDLDVAPNRPEAALLVKERNGRLKLILWNIGRASQSSHTIIVPENMTLSAITWHPLGKTLILLSNAIGKSQILTTDINGWHPLVLYTSHSPLSRLIVSPRPFVSMKSNEKYRIFFGVERTDGTFSTHTITDSGDREYAVLDSRPNSFHFPGEGEDPNTILEKNALPVRFHPAGNFMLWENGKHCFQKAVYAGNNWNDKAENLVGSEAVCNGSVAYTPNGAALLHWQKGQNGVEFIGDRGKHTSVIAGGIRFLTMPSSVPDGRGLVGVTVSNSQETVSYVPIDVPLADVANVWMYLESSHDRELLTKNTGLFRSLDNQEQLYQLYDSESYTCGHDYNESIPTRPYFVTTDVFWELYASAFEGIFVLSEREKAVPLFWGFVKQASVALRGGHPNSNVAKVFSTLMDIHNGSVKPGSEAEKIMQSSGMSRSLINGLDFDYGNLKPRSHYATDTGLRNYFRAFKYLTGFEFNDDDIEILKSLPRKVQRNAFAWIQVYEPFIASSRNRVIWNRNVIPDYIQAPPLAKEQVFPLSWGVDNEILYNVVFDRTKNPVFRQLSDERLLPSGLDVAAVLGSNIAEVFLEQAGEFSRYPSLQAKIGELRARLRQSKSWQKPDDSLYEKWLLGLAIQWANDITSPNNVIQKKFWQRKQLQTGLASWATLRHATVLVNERSDAECGEAGFEDIILTPPRGYVEPDPNTFEAIAKLFDATIGLIATTGVSPSGFVPTYPGEQDGLQGGIIRRLKESRDRVRVYRDIAIKEIEGKPLSNQDYEDILYVGRAAEHNLLIFKSLAKKDFALSTPDPITKIADVAGNSNTGLLLAGVGRPTEWDQVVPFFGRKEVVKGATYSYYELRSPSVMSDKEWTQMVKTLPHPAWIAPYFSIDALSCPATDP